MTVGAFLASAMICMGLGCNLLVGLIHLASLANLLQALSETITLLNKKFNYN
jgi:hypothetical protein